MVLSVSRSSSKVNLLPFGSLAGALPPAEPDTLFVMGANGGMSVAPDAGFQLLFGRNDPEVHVCVGPDDPHVSRRHGVISYVNTRWVLDNTGKLPIRIADSRLLLRGHRVELGMTYTPLFIVGPEREHLLEVRVSPRAVSSVDERNPANRFESVTRTRIGWELSPLERLVLVCLAQRYLRHETQPQPLTWAQVATELSDLRPNESWGPSRVAHIVTKVRKRLSPRVRGLVENEVPSPVGNALNHNLITELLLSTTIDSSDLRLLYA